MGQKNLILTIISFQEKMQNSKLRADAENPDINNFHPAKGTNYEG